MRVLCDKLNLGRTTIIWGSPRAKRVSSRVEINIQILNRAAETVRYSHISHSSFRICNEQNNFLETKKASWTIRFFFFHEKLKFSFKIKEKNLVLIITMLLKFSTEFKFGIWILELCSPIRSINLIYCCRQVLQLLRPIILG